MAPLQFHPENYLAMEVEFARPIGSAVPLIWGMGLWLQTGGHVSQHAGRVSSLREYACTNRHCLWPFYGISRPGDMSWHL